VPARTNLVGHGQVGVQIGVSGAAVAVREGRRDHTVGVELGHSLGTHAGERHVVFDVFEGVGDGLIMNIFKGFRAKPLGLDFYIGLPTSIDRNRVAYLHAWSQALLHLNTMPPRFVAGMLNPFGLTSGPL
jgi:hypothetical protein